MGVCIRYAKSREEAEEILLEGFLRVFTYIKKFRGTGSFEGWIRRIMVNCALQRYRNTTNLYAVLPLDAGKPDAITHPDTYSNLGKKELALLVQSLPAGYRIVFNLYVFEGFKHHEIAGALSISEGTSKSNLHDARAILQKALNGKKNLVHFK